MPHAYWMILIAVTFVFICGVVAAFRPKNEMGYWTVLVISAIAGGINLSKLMADWDSSAIFVASIVVALIFFGLGLELGNWALSWREARGHLQKLSEDGLSND